MRKLFMMLVATLLAVMVVAPVAAQDERNLVEAAQRATGFDTLLAAAEAAGLADTLANDGPFTVFAPTDGGFATALANLGLTAEELLADTELLTTILSFHVVNGDFSASDLISVIQNDADGVAELTTIGGEVLTAELVTFPVAAAAEEGQPTPEPQFETAIFLNGQGVSVFLADIEASNGVLHAVSGVLIPPSFSMMDSGEEMAMEEMSEEMMAPATIADVAATTEGFSVLAAAVEAAGLGEALSTGNLTVFAPTDDAFGAALESLGLTAEELLADTDTLTAILTYHVVNGDFSAEDLTSLASNGIDGLNTLNGERLSLTVDGGTVMVDGATVVSADIEADNGIVHVIDSVLLPPSMME